jgi:hypothetical protein
MCKFVVLSGLTFAIRRSSRASGDPLDDAVTAVLENVDSSSVTATTKVDANDRSLWRRGRCDVLVGVGIVAGIVCVDTDAWFLSLSASLDES